MAKRIQRREYVLFFVPNMVRFWKCWKSVHNVSLGVNNQNLVGRNRPALYGLPKFTCSVHTDCQEFFVGGRVQGKRPGRFFDRYFVFRFSRFLNIQMIEGMAVAYGKYNTHRGTTVWKKESCPVIGIAVLCFLARRHFSSFSVPIHQNPLADGEKQSFFGDE